MKFSKIKKIALTSVALVGIVFVNNANADYYANSGTLTLTNTMGNGYVPQPQLTALTTAIAPSSTFQISWTSLVNSQGSGVLYMPQINFYTSNSLNSLVAGAGIVLSTSPNQNGMTAGNVTYTYFSISSSTPPQGTYTITATGLNIASYTAPVQQGGGGLGGNPGGVQGCLGACPVQGGGGSIPVITSRMTLANLLAVGPVPQVTLNNGVLQATVAGTYSTGLLIGNNPSVGTAASGTIDQSGVRSVLTGVIADATHSNPGKLIIQNTGTSGVGAIALAAVNTYSGGTVVNSGANLAIASNAALGTGDLFLVGTATTPAILTTTADVTLARNIYVQGDPVFNVAPGTTTTVANPIADGSTSGDVVVSGGGTLNLTAVNTYTGLTSIDAGSTLALSGAGSIATSSSLTNNGIFDITAAASKVTVQSYTQTATGKLAMAIAPGSFQQLNINGSASLAGSLALTAGAGKYAAGQYTLLTATGGVTGTFGSLTTNLSSYTNAAYGLTYDANDVYLNIAAGPTTADTQQSLVNTSAALQNTFTLQNAVLANSFSYDCAEFGANNICVSAGGRNTAVSAANGLNNTSALLIAAYRPHPNYRIGAYADQNLSVNNANSGVNLGNNTPLIGLFGVWNERLDGTGTEVKVAAAYGQKNTTVTRQVVGTSEAGSGSSQLTSQGAQVTAKYGFGVAKDVIVSPYAGIRYTQNNMGGYTEGASATVTAPLTYSALNTNATTALAGVGASYRFIPQAGVYGSAGVETDTNTANGSYSATGVAGLTPINFNANPVKTRPTATIGAYYDVEKNQRVGITGIYRQEPFQAVSSTTVMATYTIGM